MKADNIKNIISDIDHLPYRAILFDGTWGIGKSYAVNEALEANPNVCKISMFGLKDTRQIYHEALFQLALKNNIGGKIGEIANNILDGASKIWDKVGQAKEAVQSIVNEREMFLLLSKEFTSVHIIVIDDLERMSDDINLEDIFGIIEELKQCNYVKVIVIANTDEIQSDKKVVFEKYNEKVIERIYHITERAEKVTWSKMNIHADFVEKFLEIHKVKNLCKKYGMDTSRYNFLHAPEFFEKMETQEVRVELSRARDAANTISARMAKVLDQNRNATYRQSEAEKNGQDSSENVKDKKENPEPEKKEQKSRGQHRKEAR